MFHQLDNMGKCRVELICNSNELGISFGGWRGSDTASEFAISIVFFCKMLCAEDYEEWSCSDCICVSCCFVRKILFGWYPVRNLLAIIAL